MSYAEVYLRGEARAQVPDRLASCSRVAVNVAVKCERKVSRKLGGRRRQHQPRPPGSQHAAIGDRGCVLASGVLVPIWSLPGNHSPGPAGDRLPRSERHGSRLGLAPPRSGAQRPRCVTWSPDTGCESVPALAVGLWGRVRARTITTYGSRLWIFDAHPRADCLPTVSDRGSRCSGHVGATPVVAG